MDDENAPFIEPWQPSRLEEPLWLICWGTEDQLALGLSAARDVFAARGVTPGYAALCAMAVGMYEDDPSLPEPDAAVRAAGAALEEASDAAILAAGGRLHEDNDFQVSQGPEDRLLWTTLPTLRAWRAKHGSAALDKDEREAPRST
jgi:hypothetical protein